MNYAENLHRYCLTLHQKTESKMIDQNTRNICHLIKNAFASVKRALSLYDAQCQELIFAFTFLRRFDCLIEQYNKDCYVFYKENKDKLSDKQLDIQLRDISGGYAFYNVSGYTFERLLNSDLHVEVALNSYLQGFSNAVSDILNGMNFKQNIAIMLRQSSYLVELFSFYSELDFSLSSFNNKRFIDLIYILTSEKSKNSGICATPVGISQLICECLFCKEACEGIVYDDVYDEISIYDPACGTGSLLAYAGEKAVSLSGDGKKPYLWGQEISPFSCAIAKALVLLTGNPNSYAASVNTLIYEDSDDITYQYVISNLPLDLPWTTYKERIERESLKENGRYSKGLPNTKDSQFLFIEDIVSKMDDLGGRAAFITTAYVLNGGSVTSGDSRIRRWLFESGLVETIIALPAGSLSPYTNIPVFLWILSCNESNYGKEYWKKMNGKVRLIDATKLASSKNHFKLDNEFIDSVVREYKSLENTSATQIVNKDSFGFYELNIEEKGKKKETIRISLDTDIHEYIEKERKPYAKGVIAIEFSSVEKGYSVDFSDFFKPEEAQILSLKEESDKLLSMIDTIADLKNDIRILADFNIGTSVSDTWRKIPLFAATEIIQGISKPQVIDQKYGYPFISASTLQGKYVDNELYAITNKTKLISSEDVIYIRSGVNAGEVFRGKDGLLSPMLAAVRCTDKSIILPDYLYYLLKGYEKSIKSLAIGNTIKFLKNNSILNFKCSIPSVAEQSVIVAFLDNIVSKIDNIIKSLNSSNSIFDQYRQALIENAVKGRIRLI